MDALFAGISLWSSLLVLIPTALLAGIVKGTTGFGFALVLVPILVVLLENPAHAVAIVLPLALCQDVFILLTTRGRLRFSIVSPMVLAGLVGIPIGTLVLVILPEDALRLVISLAILMAAFVVFRGFTIHTEHDRVARAAAAFVSGILLVSTGIPGPAFSVFLVSLRIHRDDFRPTFSSLFASLEVFTLASLTFSGVVTRDTLSLDGLLIWPVAIGFIVSVRFLLPNVGPQVFRKVVLIMVAIGALLSIVNGLLVIAF